MKNTNGNYECETEQGSPYLINVIALSDRLVQ